MKVSESQIREITAYFSTNPYPKPLYHDAKNQALLSKIENKYIKRKKSPQLLPMCYQIRRYATIHIHIMWDFLLKTYHRHLS